MLFVNVRRASAVELLAWPPNWLAGTRSYLPARKVSRQAMVFSRIFPRHSRRVIRRYALGLE